MINLKQIVKSKINVCGPYISCIIYLYKWEKYFSLNSH